MRSSTLAQRFAVTAWLVLLLNKLHSLDGLSISLSQVAQRPPLHWLGRGGQRGTDDGTTKRRLLQENAHR